MRIGQQAVELRVVVVGVGKQRTTTSDVEQPSCGWLEVVVVTFLASTATSCAVRGWLICGHG